MLTEPSQQLTPDAQRAQLQRLLDSRTLRSSEALKRLLEFLGRNALEGQFELKEYSVGVEAFGKPADYDPKTDSSVRVQASKLRQKLDEYYRTEGVQDPIIIDFPKGRFHLQFRERPMRLAASPGNRVLRIGGALAALVLVVTATVFVWRPWRLRAPGSPYESAELRELWSPFLDDSRPAILSLGLPLFAKVGNQFLRDPGLNDWEQLSKSPELGALESQLKRQAVPSYGYTGSGEASAAFELARLFGANFRDLNLVFSNALTWADIERNNIIFVGPPKHNLQLQDLPVRLDFVIENGRIMNLRPQPGEPAEFRESWNKDGATVQKGHALINRLPGLHGAGVIMMLASTSTEGTRAAVEYVTRNDYASQLARSLRGKNGQLPKYFQAVIRAQFKSQVPIQVELVALRELGR